MIDLESQNDLFKLISSNLKRDLEVFAFGGTAMMYYGYKNATKDIDLYFKTENDRNEFIKAIEQLGYTKRSLKGVYTEEKQKSLGKPLMYVRDDERFDLFANKIISTTLVDDFDKRVYARHDFSMGKNVLIVNVLSKEDLIFLKSITERERDFDDILTIIEKEKTIDWDYITDIAIHQKKLGNSWPILDLEKTMTKLREYTLIKKKYFDKLYDSID